jgi:hypothetical protein
MPELANIRREKFAQGVASGLTGAEAYRRVAGSNSKNADMCANESMKQAGVKERTYFGREYGRSIERAFEKAAQ